MALRALSDFKPGEEGTIKEIRGTGPFFHRLRALGLRTDEHISVLREAPLGDPIEIRVKSWRLALRRQEASHIFLAMTTGTP